MYSLIFSFTGSQRCCPDIQYTVEKKDWCTQSHCRTFQQSRERVVLHLVEGVNIAISLEFGDLYTFFLITTLRYTYIETSQLKTSIFLENKDKEFELNWLCFIIIIIKVLYTIHRPTKMPLQKDITSFNRSYNYLEGSVFGPD